MSTTVTPATNRVANSLIQRRRDLWFIGVLLASVVCLFQATQQAAEVETRSDGEFAHLYSIVLHISDADFSVATDEQGRITWIEYEVEGGPQLDLEIGDRIESIMKADVAVRHPEKYASAMNGHHGTRKVLTDIPRCEVRCSDGEWRWISVKTWTTGRGAMANCQWLEEN